jgi:hypothetical protein
MKAATEIENIIKDSEALFAGISPEKWAYKPGIHRWSKKEILGHLIDSAQNNLRRFIVTQYEPNNRIVYYQDDWVRLQNYQQMEVENIILLWKLLNQQIITVINNMPPEKLLNTCDTGKSKEELYRLGFLIDDYVVHLRHHISQIKK